MGTSTYVSPGYVPDVYDVPTDPANTHQDEAGDTVPARDMVLLLDDMGAGISASQAALEAWKAQRGATNGYPSLVGGTIPDAQIPAGIARDSEVTAAVNAAVAALVNSAPATLDTLEEIADALGDDPNFATTMTTNLASKVAKSLYDANTVLTADVDDTPAPLTMGPSTMLARLAAGNIKAATPAEIKTLLAITEADVANLTTDLTAKVPKTLFDANTVLKADADDTPAALTMGASTMLARLAAGNIVAATVGDIVTLLGINNDPSQTTITKAESYRVKKNATTNQAGFLADTKIIFVEIDLWGGVAIQTLSLWSGTTGLTRGTDVGSSHVWHILIDSAFAMVARTYDDTNTAWGANSEAPTTARTITQIATGASGTYTPSHAAGTKARFYLGCMVNKGTTGAPAVPSVLGLSSHANLMGETPSGCFEDSSSVFTTPPAFPYTATRSTDKGVIPYARCR